MPDSNVPGGTTGSAFLIDTFQLANGDHQQVVQEARGSVVSSVVWNVTTTANMSFILADTSRVMVLVISWATSRVYLRLSSSLPMPRAAVNDQYLDPGDRWEVPSECSKMPMSACGDQIGGTLAATLVSVS